MDGWEGGGADLVPCKPLLPLKLLFENSVRIWSFIRGTRRDIVVLTVDFGAFLIRAY